MGQDPLAVEFRRRLEEMHLPLKKYAPEDDRFVFELKDGEIVIDPHPTQARQLLLLAEAVYTKGQGAALELACLVAKREALEEDVSAPHVVVWRQAENTLADALPEEWVSFEEWVADQFLFEDAIACLTDGVPI
jgi:hypothetical protein